MLLSMETYVTCNLLGEETGLRLTAEAGFDAVDYNLFSDFGLTRLEEDYMEKAAHTKALLEKYGLLCNQAHGPFLFRYEHGDWTKSDLWRDMNRAIEYAAFLGARQITFHPVNVPDGVDFVAYNVDFFRSFEPVARKFGIRIAVENGPARRVMRLVERLDPEVFVYCVDTGHANNPPTWTAHEVIAQVPEGRLHALHLNDNWGVREGRWDLHFPPYYGSIDWDAVLKALAQRDYPGDFTLEIVGFLEHTPLELYPQALGLAHAVGRKMIRKFKKLKRGGTV